jgi:hypothetical protein
LTRDFDVGKTLTPSIRDGAKNRIGKSYRFLPSPKMITVAHMARHLARLTYRPGWTFQVYGGRHEGPHVVIRATLMDSTRPDRTVDIRVDSALPPFDSLEHFERWLLWRLEIIESHECREWFKRDGVPVCDPHAEHAQHDL